MKRPTIALACILKNERHNIDRLLESVAGCFDEIHLTDTGSTDGSLELLERYATKEGHPTHVSNPAQAVIRLHHFKWIDDFAAARNYSFSHPQTDFIMWMDLDDVLGNPEAFKAWRDSAMGLADYWIATYHYALEGDRPICSFIRERVVRRDRGLQWESFLHEGIKPISPIFGPVKHDYVPTWTILHRRTGQDMTLDRSRNVKMLEARKDELNSRLKYYYGKELFDGGQYPEAAVQLTAAAALEDLEMHDRILCLQYAAYSFMACNQFSRAIALAYQGVQLDPLRAEFWCVIGDCYVKLGQFGPAIPAFNAAKSCPYQGAQQGGNALSYSGLIFQHGNCYLEYPRQQLARIYFQVGDLRRAHQEALEALTMADTAETRALVHDLERAIEVATPKALEQLEASEDIVISALPNSHPYEWDEEIAKKKGVGGSETAAIHMARHLHELTGRRVVVFNTRQSALEVKGVLYESSLRAAEYFARYLPKLHIAWRHSHPATRAQTAIWCHDLRTPGIEVAPDNATVCLLTPFHQEYAHAIQGLKPEKVWLTRNGIDPKRFEGPAPAKVPGKVIFPSSPDRGLDRVIRIMERVREKVPHAELHVFYGFDNLRKYGMADMANRLEAMIKERPWVKYHGNVQQDELARHFRESEVWLYPANFIETFCITALEALASKTYPVVRRIGALRDTVGPWAAKGMATMIDQDAETELEVLHWASEVVHAIDTQAHQFIDFDANAHSWESVAKDWAARFGL